MRISSRGMSAFAAQKEMIHIVHWKRTLPCAAHYGVRVVEDCVDEYGCYFFRSTKQ
jgi:hypothetical protein